MGGAIAIVVILVVVVPVLVLVSGMILAAIIGTTLVIDGEENHKGSELLETNT